MLVSLAGKENFTIPRNAVNSAETALPANTVYSTRSQQHPAKTHNYSPFRDADCQQVRRFLPTSFHFLNKQATILASHPGKLYLRSKINMNSHTNIQEYRRYRDAQHHPPTKVLDIHGQYLHNPCYLQVSKRNENEYSRYRNSYTSSRDKSATRAPSKTHYKCRSLTYDTEAQRAHVPDDKVSWTVDYPDYKPVEYTTTKIQRNPKADPMDASTIKKYNRIDNKIDRRSFTGHYLIDSTTGRPRNPIGRTGMTGRGRLYYWGPNHAGDPVVTRWKRDGTGAIVYRRSATTDSSKPVLEFVSIQRRDTKEWAIPGGMVDPGENISETVKREFREEAAQHGVDEECVQRLFSNGYKIFESYVDDPRNTDNAWMETIAMHFHDETGQLTKHLELHAADDAENSVWCTIDRTLQLYACHTDLIRAAVDRLDAFW